MLQAIANLQTLIINKMKEWIKKMKRSLINVIQKKQVCKNKLQGLECRIENCQHNVNPNLNAEIALLKLFNLSVIYNSLYIYKQFLTSLNLRKIIR